MHAASGKQALHDRHAATSVDAQQSPSKSKAAGKQPQAAFAAGPSSAVISQDNSKQCDTPSTSDPSGASETPVKKKGRPKGSKNKAVAAKYVLVLHLSFAIHVPSHRVLPHVFCKKHPQSTHLSQTLP